MPDNLGRDGKISEARYSFLPECRYTKSNNRPSRGQKWTRIADFVQRRHARLEGVACKFSVERSGLSLSRFTPTCQIACYKLRRLGSDVFPHFMG